MTTVEDAIAEILNIQRDINKLNSKALDSLTNRIEKLEKEISFLRQNAELRR